MRWSVLLWLVPLMAGASWLAYAVLGPEEPVAVRAYRVETGAVESTVSNLKAGTVEARRRAKLSTGTSGVVVALEVERGDRVRAGDVLLRLEDSTQSAELTLAERDVAVARARSERACIAAERARRELERHLGLSEESLVAEDLLDQLESAHRVALAECDVAAAEVSRGEAAVELARANHAKTVLRAPFDARIAEVSVELGEWVTPSVPLLAAPDLIDAIDTGSLYVSAPMDEVDAARLAVGQRARVTIDSHPGRSFPARVARVAPYVLDVEQQNRTVEVEVELDDAELAAELLPGTSADVEVILEVRSGVVRVPAHALLEGGTVLVVEDGVAVEREVELGLGNWDWVEVRSGLSAGERVITDLDRPEVEDGARVDVLEPAP